ncbi:DMT family transporter [Paraburkholderia sp. DHOC27]|uniref:DMT family transporter n=1 Tax=Paraburkholderia sp. DHOC27 TaxID=2303330 RepID=UPI000E3E0389|nr:DMT family transporter [Paraburkholderia sp. DHOC27]RFU49080.1 DMT family transporter [Paraburkholderia sp. DHOC27]
MLSTIAPVLFVLVWSTGLVVARAVVPHASAEMFLFARMALSAAVLAALALSGREPWPRRSQFTMHLLAGAMLHGVYLSAAYWAIGHGMPVGVMSLLGSMQPLVSVIALFLMTGERPSSRTVVGLATGIAGVTLVLFPALDGIGHQPITLWTALIAILAVIGMSVGTLLQRGRLANDGVRVSASVQNAGGALVALVAMLTSGSYEWTPSFTLWFSLLWSVLGLSVGATLLIVWMVRAHGVTKMSALLLAVPGLAAIEAWFLFGERLTVTQIAGFGLALMGVVLARSMAPKRASGHVSGASGAR